MLRLLYTTLLAGLLALSSNAHAQMLGGASIATTAGITAVTGPEAAAPVSETPGPAIPGTAIPGRAVLTIISGASVVGQGYPNDRDISITYYDLGWNGLASFLSLAFPISMSCAGIGASMESNPNYNLVTIQTTYAASHLYPAGTKVSVSPDHFIVNCYNE
jgi:hypothetical protein